jgi:hypothetical protein
MTMTYFNTVLIDFWVGPRWRCEIDGVGRSKDIIGVCCFRQIPALENFSSLKGLSMGHSQSDCQSASCWRK